MAMVKAQQEADANYNAAMEQYNAQVQAAEETLNAWTGIASLMEECDQQVHDAAVAERKQRAEATAQTADGTEGGEGSESKKTAENGSDGLRNVGQGRTEGRSDQRQGDLAEAGDGKARELDNNGRLEERRKKILANMGDKYSLSDEYADNGEAFIQNESGSTNLAKIPDEIFDRIGITPVPFKLTETMGWHVFDHHGKEAKLNSISDAVDFVLSIVNNVDHVRLGRDNSYIFSVENNRKRVGRRAVTIMINSKTGEFMGIRTSGYETLKNIQERPLLWERGADTAPEDVATPTITTIEPQQGDEETSRAKSQSNVSSESKVNDNQPTLQGKEEKSSENKGVSPLSEKIATASAEVNTEPTEAQKEAGNYKKGHVQVGTFDITIEQPQGSVRRGTDADGKAWESRMHNTYGYFRGTEGVDGDHIDVFLSNDIDGWNGREVYVVDQYNPDGTFDEHKVMLCFNDMGEAKSDYLANYEKGWEDGRRIVVSATNLEDFEKWIDSRHRKTKPFAEYAGVKKETVANAPVKEAAAPNNKPRLQKAGVAAAPVSKNERVLRDALDERLSKSGMEVIGTDEGQRVLDAANGEDVRKMSFGEPYDYEKYPLGRVEPGIADKDVNVVDADANHGFANYKEAKEWAKGNISKTYNNEETGGKGNVRISNAAIDKFMSQSAINKSDGKDVHMAVLKVLPEVLKESIDVETHPDFLKGENGKRSSENGINKDVLVHRCYGAVNVDGKPYRVKITLKENVKTRETTNAYSYEATKIELLAGQHGDVTMTSPRNSNNSITGAKLLKDVEMSYNPGVKVLDESKKRSEKIRNHKVYHGSGAYFDHFDHSHMGEGEGAQAYGWGTYVTEVEGIGRHYAKVGFLSAENKKMEEDDPIVLAVGEIIEREKQNRQVVPFEQRKVSAISELETYVKSIEEALAKETDAEDIAFYKKELARSKASLDILKPMTEKQYVDERLRQERMRHLYTAEIPDDNGSNYLQWNRLYKDDVLYSLLNKIGKALEAKGVDLNKDYNQKASWNTWIERLKIDGEAWTPNVATGEEIYEKLSKMLGENAYQENQEKASQILADAGFTGIKYPADYMRGGREDGKKNYVIFNEEDAKITDHVRFFRTKNGEAYGFTVGGKIYYDPRIATSETLVHEYAHLWASALRGGNAEEWKNVAGLMKGTSVWDEVKRLYPELKTDDEIADEVIAQYSGRRGAERLREEAKRIAEGNGGVFEKAEAISALEKVKRALSKFWKGVCDMLHIHYTSADEVADRVMKDLLDGVDPRKFGKDNALRMQEEAELKKVNEAFNQRLDELVADPNQKDRVLRLGHASSFLKDGGVADADIELEFDRFVRKSGEKYKNHHPFNVIDLKDLPMAIANPIAIFNSTNANDHVVLTELQKDGKNFIVAIRAMEQHRKGGVVLEVNQITSLYPKEEKEIVNWINTGRISNVDKEKALHFIEALQPHAGTTITSEELNSAANVIQSFETTKGTDGKRSFKSDKTLVGVHNITEEKLRKALKLGGFANPSLAVIDTDKNAHNGFGEISFIAPSALIDKRTGRNAGTFFGDAWTPTYPTVERQMSVNGSKKATQDVMSVPKEMQGKVRMGIDRYLDSGDANSGLAYLFLHERGEAPAIQKTQTVYDDKVYEELKLITSGNFNIRNIGKADMDKVLNMYIDAKYGGDRAAYEQSMQNWLEKNKAYVEAGTKEGMRFAIAKQNVEIYDEYGFNFKSVQSFVNDVDYDHRRGGKADLDGTLKAADDYVLSNDLIVDFGNWLNGKDKEYEVKEVIFDGFTPSGKRKYVPNDLEHVSKIMKKQGLNGASGQAFAFNNFVAVVMEKTGALDKLRKRKDMLTNNHDDTDRFTDKWATVFNELAEILNPNSKELFDDAGYYRLAEVALMNNPKEYVKKEYGVDLTDKDIDKMHSLVEAIRKERPTMYFETKFERPVHLNEFAAVVVPNNLGADVRKGLEESGLRLYEYDAKKEGDRQRAFDEAINSGDGIRFQFVGERGAKAADRAEEVTTRLDNLSVAREMEEAKKGKEIFNDFYTNRKASSFGTSNTSEEAHTSNDNAFNAAKVVENFEKPKVSAKNVADEGMKSRLLEDDDPKAQEANNEAKADRVNELAERLHTPVRIIRTDEEVASLPSARQRRMKGSFNPMTGEVTIVVPNNANLADVENTFIHEVVGHDGLRVLFPEEEKLNNALDELYRVSNEGIRQTIDRMAQKMYDAEVDRLREKKRREHEARGEDANAHYYADMAEAHVEASKKREQFRRDATEEYGADLAGRIGESGFEKMSAEEKTFWGKLKAMLQKALAQLLEGLKIPGKRKWSDKDWAFVLHEAYKRKKNGGRPTVFDAADTEVMRRKTGFDKVMFSDGAIREELDRVNERFNEQLAKFTLDNADKINFNLGNPSEKLLSAGVADKPIRLHGSKVAKKMKKHGFTIDELHDLPKAVANPIAVFDNLGKDGNRSVLTELKTANGNFLVTIDLGKGTEADFDIVSSVFGKRGHSVAAWINKGYMRYVDKKKALNYLHLSAPIAEASDNAELSSAAKIVENFENPTVSAENVADDDIMFRDGDSVDYEKALARDVYERRVSRGMYQMQEALQDSMLGLKEAMDAILKAEGGTYTGMMEDVAGYENAYLGENRLSSVNQAETAAFARTLFKPMLEEVAKLAKTADERAALTDYMMAKHGLERNDVMARRAAAKQADKEFGAELLILIVSFVYDRVEFYELTIVFLTVVDYIGDLFSYCRRHMGARSRIMSIQIC